MKLFRFGDAGNERPGVILANGHRIDVSAIGSDFDERFFDSGGLSKLEAWVAANAALAPRVPETVRLGPAIARPSKIVCIGLNYVDHAKETGAQIPKEPVIFFKATTAWNGPNDDVLIPRGGSKLDWEVELAIVIGKRTKHVSRDDAYDHIAGYALHNDYSERFFQLERGGQWVKGKSCDTFAPFGPFVATRDEVRNVQELPMWLAVNGTTRQKSNTANMVFDVPTLVSYVSQFMTLLPGDVISTGTPAGVGLGHNPPLYLEPGDVVECGIEGLGTSRQHIAREE
jgi:2,4-didehydro-3-deoxy-L-rhamnonate hydrolase